MRAKRATTRARRLSPLWLLLLAMAMVLLVVLPSAASVYAQDPEPPEDAGSSDTPGALGTVKSFLYEMVFPIEDMTQALRRSLGLILQGTFEGLEELYALALREIAFGEYAWGPSIDMVRPLWSRVLQVSAVLWPLVLALNVLAVARGGVIASAVGYADLKEAIIEWVAACAGAAASLYVMRWALELSNAIGHLLLPHNDSEVAWAIAHAIADSALATVAGGVFFLVFLLFLSFAMMTAFLLSFLARYVILFVLMNVAPLTLTMGAVPATRWLSWLWIKGIVLALLLRPVNSLILSLAVRAAAGGAVIVRMLVVTGILSIMLAINYAVANAVFAAVGEVLQKAKGTMQQLAATVVLAGGGAALGAAALGGGGAAATGGGAAGAAGGGGGAAGGGSGAAGGAAAGGEAAAAGEAAAGGGAAGEAGGGAGGGAGAGAGSRAGAGRGGIGSRIRSALQDPNAKRRLGKVARSIGRGLQFTSSGPVGRAMGSMVAGGGDLLADSGRQESAALRERYGNQRESLVGWGMDPNQSGFYDVADAMQQLESEYGHGRVREFAGPTARMMAAATQDGGDLNALAQQAGFSSPGAWFGNRVEEGIQGFYGGGGSSMFSSGSGLQTPDSGNLTAYDYTRGLELAQTLGRTGHERQVRAHSRLVHAFRGAAGEEGVNALLGEARSLQGQYMGRNEWRRWAPFAEAATEMAAARGVELRGPAANELQHLKDFRPSTAF